MNTPRAQALIGFVRDDPQTLTNLRAEVQNEFCAILCTSLDDLPIAESAKLLLVTTAKVENSEMAWQADGTTVAEWARLPMAIEPVTGTITLTGLGSAKQVVVQPLSAVGVPQGRNTAAAPTASGWSFPIGSDAITTWYVISIDRRDGTPNGTPNGRPDATPQSSPVRAEFDLIEHVLASTGLKHSGMWRITCRLLDSFHRGRSGEPTCNSHCVPSV